MRPQHLAVGHCERTRKLAFRSFAKAKRASILIRTRSPERLESNVYQCPDCGFFHTTSWPRRDA